jgi:hypothetical protein
LYPRRFESKSLRIAGGCILATNNVPNYIIKMAGRWKSDVFMRYIRFGVHTHVYIASTIFAFKSMTFDDVRRVSRRLHCQELPTSKRQQSEILAPLIFADHAAGTDPTCERAGCGLWLEVIGGSYIFFRRPGVDCYTAPTLSPRTSPSTQQRYLPSN